MAKEFNENPFLKDTPVVPFSNGSEAESWHSSNCQKCIKYESESTNENDAKCKLAFHLDLGFLGGDLPLWVAKDIGCTYNPLYQTCRLNSQCRKFDNGDGYLPF
jgi:hypothetical protein